MSIVSDIAFAFKPRCPHCRKGRLFKPFSLAVMDKCEACGADLESSDVGDGAAVFLIFILGFTIIPLCWFAEVLFSPPLWAHVLGGGAAILLGIVLLMPAVKAYIILLNARHRD